MPAPRFTPVSDQVLAAAFRARGYEIERELGRGGMATVYLAHDVKHDRRVALKVLSPELSTPQLADRFAAEIRVTANLSHPNILPLFDSGNADGRLYYAMPYLEGDSLRARLEREKNLPVDEAVALMRVLAGALEYAHKRGVIHRDIKPENILFQDGQPLVADFGIALALSSVGVERLTATGVSIGTPQYMSPEQAAGELTVGPQSDIYSLAAVAYELLAGEPPFSGPNTQAVLARVMLEPPRPIRTVRSTVPAPVEAAILQALAKHPVDRFSTAAAFSAALRDVGAHSKPGWPRWIRGRTAAAAGVGVLAIAIAVSLGGFPKKPTSVQRVLVADFVGPRTDEHIAVVIQELVSSALNQSRTVTTIARDQLTAARRAALIADTATLRLDRARHLALRTQVRTVVDGRVDRVGASYSIVLHAVNSWDGKTVATVQAAASDSNLVATVNHMSRDLGRQLASSDTTAMPRIRWAASTPSLEAYRLLVEAVEAADMPAAMRLAQQALRHDPEFASAWNHLAYVSAQGLWGMDSILFAYRQALRFGSRLSPPEKLYVQGMMAYRTGRSDSAVRLFDAALLEDPSNADVYHDRAMALRLLGRWDDAAESFQLSVQRETIRTPVNALNSLATTLAFNGQVDSARVVARRIPPGGLRLDAELHVAIAGAEWDTVRRIARRAASDPSNSPEGRLGMLQLIASTQVARGQIDSAWLTLKEADAIRPDPFRFARADVLIGVPSGIPPASRRAPSPADTMSYHPFFRTVWHAWRGDSVAAARAIKEFRGRIDPTREPHHVRQADFFERWNVSGPSGPRSVIDHVAPLAWSGNAAMFGSNVLQRWFVADAYERLGRLDSAAMYFELLVRPKRMHFKQGEQLGFTHSFALRRLALLYERMGQPAQARRHWQQFLDTFTDPDPELRPLVAEARAALARRN